MVSAYISGVTSPTCDPNDSENWLNKCNSNNMHNKSNDEITNRTGKFLFDTLFNINPQFDDLVDDDDDEKEPCKCGECLFVCVCILFTDIL